jgi:hypothetical protein
MSAAYCEPLVETCFSSLPGSGGSVGGTSPASSGWMGTLASGWIWFRCAYDGCHPGIGHVVIESKAGEILYDGCPTEGTRKLIWLDFPAAKLWQGGLMQVNYGLPGCSGAGHVCNRATFEWGSYENTANPLGVAYLDNAGGANDQGNVCDGPALEVWRAIVQSGVPNTPYIESSPPWVSDGIGKPVGASTFQDHILGPYNKDYWIFSGNLAVDDDLMIDGVRVFADGYSNQVGGGNVFLKFLPKGGTARLNAWNAGGWTGASGAVRLYPSSGVGSSGGFSRCNAFIIPPQTIGAYKFKGEDGAVGEGARKVFYQLGGVADPVPCPDAGAIPAGYVPKVSQVALAVVGGTRTATASFGQVIASWPAQVPLAKRALVGAGELWAVKIFLNGGHVAGFWLSLFFPSEGYQGGMIEVGAAISNTDFYTTEVVRVGENAVLSLVYTPWGEAAITLALQVDVAFIPV